MKYTLIGSVALGLVLLAGCSQQPGPSKQEVNEVVQESWQKSLELSSFFMTDEQTEHLKKLKPEVETLKCEEDGSKEKVRCLIEVETILPDGEKVTDEFRQTFRKEFGQWKMDGVLRMTR